MNSIKRRDVGAALAAISASRLKPLLHKISAFAGMTAKTLLCASLLVLQACNNTPGNINRADKQAPTPTPEPRPAGLLDPLPDRLPLLSLPVPRGSLITQAHAPRTPSAKTVDGRIEDWIGEPSRIGGAARWDAGEHIYTDYLFDAYGADDGADAQRLSRLDPLADAEPRTFRLDQLAQAAGDQFDAPPPAGALDHYGDATTLDAQADLTEVRWAADAARVYLLARTSTLTDAAVGLLVLLDTQDGPAAAHEVGFGSGLSTAIFDTALRLTPSGVVLRDLASGAERVVSDAQLAIRSEGWNNALETGLPADLFAGLRGAGVIAGIPADTSFTPANAAYRFFEPVAGVYNEKRQALALLAGNVDAFVAQISLESMRGGATESARPGPGYHERQIVSGENISREDGENGILQPYGLYVPQAYDPLAPNPLTFWLHYRGGKAHSGAAWTPRLITQLGEEQNNIVVTPRGRGTSTWYVSQAHQDFFEVYDDVHGLLNVDADRRYLSGYSMGGYGTFLFGLLYPDLFAAGYSTSGALTQGAWTGIGPDSPLCVGEAEIPTQGPGNFCFIQANEGDANAQLSYRLLDNALHFPITLHHGTNDELVPVSGIAATALRLTQLGYRHDLHTFIGYEHFTQAIIDEWGDGATYLNQFKREANPREVVYKIAPALLRAINTVRADDVVFNFNPSGAYWARELIVREAKPGDPANFGMIDAVSEALAAPMVQSVPRVVDGVSTPVFSPTQHSTPFVRTGLDWLALGDEPLRNGFSVIATSLAAASLDTARMALDLTARVDASITSDGPLMLTLTQVTTPVQVYLNGVPHDAAAKDQRLLIPIADGVTQLILLPEGAPPP